MTHKKLKFNNKTKPNPNRTEFPGLPVHGKAGNLNHTLKFVIFGRQVK